MKYYRRKEVAPVDYTSEEFAPCWTCQNACGGCSWSKDFQPVKGWQAEKTFLPSNGEFAESYRIIECPQYKPDRK